MKRANRAQPASDRVASDSAGGDEMTGTIERTKRSDYRRFQTISTRWMDNDVYGHVNNVVY